MSFRDLKLEAEIFAESVMLQSAASALRAGIVTDSLAEAERLIAGLQSSKLDVRLTRLRPVYLAAARECKAEADIYEHMSKTLLRQIRGRDG